MFLSSPLFMVQLFCTHMLGNCKFFNQKDDLVNGLVMLEFQNGRRFQKVPSMSHRVVMSR